MVRHLFSIASFLALGALVSAAPGPAGVIPGTKSVTLLLTTEHTATTTAKTTPTSSGTPASSKISIPDAVIDAAPVQNNPPTSKFSSIPGGGDNSTLLQARPDLQTHVNNAIHLATNKTTSKRDTALSDALSKRTPEPDFCIGSVDLDQPTWNKIAVKICKEWYPSASSYQYDPSSDWPSNLKSASIPAIFVGGTVGTVSLSFAYGVDDWSFTANYGWQPYYEPQSQALCIADLQTLINEMVNANVCLGTSGYDTSGVINGNTAGGVQDFLGTLQPKWYTFSAT
jgi:hypothetical protein